MLYICSMFHNNIFELQIFRTDTIFILNNAKENYSDKKGGIMVLILCMMSDEALYLYQVS